jgi:hypothetical protein
MVISMNATAARAHPGGLNAEGCHTNRKTGEYHCHRKTGAPQTFLKRPAAKKPAGKKKVCADFPPCEGCGCAGGPGYRSNSTGECVGYKKLVSECGPFPHVGCTFENAPGTGVNRECVLGGDSLY